MPQISPLDRCRTLLIKFGESLKKTKSTAFILMKRPGDKETGMILMGTPDAATEMLYNAIKDNLQIRALVYSAVDYDQKVLKEQAEKANKIINPENKLILTK